MSPRSPYGHFSFTKKNVATEQPLEYGHWRAGLGKTERGKKSVVLLVYLLICFLFRKCYYLWLFHIKQNR